MINKDLVEVLEKTILNTIIDFNNATGLTVKRVNCYQAGNYVNGNNSYAVKAEVEDK